MFKKNLLMTLIILSIIFFISCKKSNHDFTDRDNVSTISSASPLEGEVVNGVRQIKMEVNNTQFTPKKFYVQVNEKVKIALRSTFGNHKVKFDRINIEVEIPEGKQKTVEFTAPKSPAKVNFWCETVGRRKLNGYFIVKGK